MRHSTAILSLLAVLVLLIILRQYYAQREARTYPLQIDFLSLDTDEEYASNNKIIFAVDDRINNYCENPLFFCPAGISLEMGHEKLQKTSMLDSYITIDGDRIPSILSYNFNKEGFLNSVFVRIESSYSKAVEDAILAYFGDHRLDINGDYGINHRVWFFPSFYVYYAHDTMLKDEDTYITISLYNNQSGRDLCLLAKYGNSAKYSKY